MPKGVYERKPMADRIKEGIDICPERGCWIWKMRLDKDGYGQISDKCKTRHTHKVAYETFKESIPEGMVCSHICDEKYSIDSKEYRKCCNPDHISIVSPAENSKRMKDLGRTVAPTKWKTGETAGENNVKAKLTKDKVLEILQRHKEAKYGDLKKLATEYGVEYQTVYKIITGKSWKPVYDEFHSTEA
jgi:hypothetical protein